MAKAKQAVSKPARKAPANLKVVTKIQAAASWYPGPPKPYVIVTGRVFQQNGNPSVNNIVACDGSWNVSATGKSIQNGVFSVKITPGPASPAGQTVKIQCEAAKLTVQVFPAKRAGKRTSKDADGDVGACLQECAVAFADQIADCEDLEGPARVKCISAARKAYRKCKEGCTSAEPPRKTKR
jgi:hypothetical protein